MVELEYVLISGGEMSNESGSQEYQTSLVGKQVLTKLTKDTLKDFTTHKNCVKSHSNIYPSPSNSHFPLL